MTKAKKSKIYEIRLKNCLLCPANQWGKNMRETYCTQIQYKINPFSTK